MNKKIFFTFIGILIVVFIIFINREFSFQRIIQLNLFYLIILIILSILINLICGLRWGFIVNLLEGKKILPYRKFLFYYTLSVFISIYSFQELSNFATRLGSLTLEKVSIQNSINAYLIEKTLNFFNLISICWISILYFLKILPIPIIWPIAIFSFFIFYFLINNKKLNILKIIFYLNKIFLIVIKKLHLLNKNFDLNSLNNNWSLLFSSPQIKKLYSLSIIKFILNILLIYFTFKIFHINISFLNVFLAVPLVDLGMLFAFTPGALGIFEGGWFIILKILTFSPLDINTFLIGGRLTSLIAILSSTLFFYLLFLTIRGENKIKNDN